MHQLHKVEFLICTILLGNKLDSDSDSRGDARCDSPGKQDHKLNIGWTIKHAYIHIYIYKGKCICCPTGFSSKYSTYSFQDASKEIVHYEFVKINMNA